MITKQYECNHLTQDVQPVPKEMAHCYYCGYYGEYGVEVVDTDHRGISGRDFLVTACKNISDCQTRLHQMFEEVKDV